MFIIMEIVKFFVFSLIAECATLELSELRAKSALKPTDVRRVAEKTSECAGFSKTLKENFEGGKFRVKDAAVSILFYDLEYTKRVFESLDYTLMSLSSTYVVQHLRAYCDLALEVMTLEFEGATAKDKLETLRFTGQHERCVFTAFNDLGLTRDLLEIDLLFESLVFFQTVSADESSLDGIHSYVLWYKRRYDRLLMETRTEILQVPTLGVNLGEYREALAAVEKIIADFALEFCTSWTPFVRGDVLRAETTTNDDVPKPQSPFIRHVLQHELCDIEVIEEDDIYINNQSHWISWWKCDRILESQEYRYETYKENMITARQTSRAPSNPVRLRSENSNPFTGVSEISLAALQEALESNTYYLNAVRYYNIMADVVLSVSIKEGGKILKGIKKLAAALWRDGARETRGMRAVEELREMRSVLSRYMSAFEDLAFLILNQKRILIRVVDHMEWFDDRVNGVMRVLDTVRNFDGMTGEPRTADRVCSEITRTLAHLRGDDDDDDAYLHGGGADKWIRFKEFYFTESILHMRELYSYSANNF